MGLKQHSDESPDAWALRVKQYEMGRALIQISQGHDSAQVAEEFSRRVMNKLEHWLIAYLQQIHKSNYDSQQSQQDYAENYLKRFGPKSDHVKEDDHG